MQWVTTKYLSQRSNVADASATTCFFYIPSILFNALPGTQQIKNMKTWQQVLAQQMKPLISPILTILTPQKPLNS